MCTCHTCACTLQTMKNETPMVRLNSHVRKHVHEALQAAAEEEGIPYAEVVRQVIDAGMLTRQDRRTHQTRMAALIESLEAQVKIHEQRISELERKAAAPSS